MSLLEARAVDLRAGGRLLCRNLELALRAGECWGLLGRNGAGKTTLLHTLAGLSAPAAGRVLLDGRELTRWGGRERARQIGLLPQDSVDVFPASVLETALIGRHPHLGPWQVEGAEDEEIARRALAETGLADAAARSVTTLSGGERRRLALATLWVQAPRVWLLDEPNNHLDITHQVALLERLRAQALNAGGAVLMSLHDVNLALRLCNRLLLLHGDAAGSWEALERTDLLDATRLARVYGHRMLEMSGEGRRGFVPA
jgi:iron complex transport system ATP-binding protein